jgi:hypothetical protein
VLAIGTTDAMVRTAVPGCQTESRRTAGTQGKLGNVALGQLGDWGGGEGCGLREAIEAVVGGWVVRGFVVFGVGVLTVGPAGTAPETAQTTQGIPHPVSGLGRLARFHGQGRWRNPGGVAEEDLVFRRGRPRRERPRHFPLRRVAVLSGRRIGVTRAARRRDAENLIAEEVEHGSPLTCDPRRVCASAGVSAEVRETFRKKCTPHLAGMAIR